MTLRLWAFIGVMLLALLIGLRIIPSETTKGRLTPQKTHDPGVLLTMRLAAFGTIVTAIIDVTGAHWSDRVPLAVSAVGLLFVALALGFAMSAVRANKFFMPAVRIQAERGHHVVDSGPYRLVRHPGYLAMAFLTPSIALAVGSWVALVPALVFTSAVVYRSWGEDRFLHANLEGYPAYAARTRYRLIPGVW